ncbi:MAG: 3-deoxy-manno-octulosonate cytidylyltransferase [Planctomycetes bacterium]|nr:3-deoxy-manno-octulosonate cytidylyltransferase [Planctomycetota bacterium]
MSVIAVIPARYASTRFPGKPLAKKTGKYLVQHVFEQVQKADLIDGILIATDDLRIFSACEEFGAKCKMTSPSHPSGTDRIAEVACDLDASIIVNIQADEPQIDPKHIDLLVKLLQSDKQADLATLAAPFDPQDRLDDPNIVKVVIDCKDRALYFSRSCIPYEPKPDHPGPCHHKHIGIYAYRKQALLTLSRLEPSALERVEKLEQLRALENGLMIAVARVEHHAVGIDTPQQYEEFVRNTLKTSQAPANTGQ